MIFELQLSLNQVMMATFSVEQLHVGDKDFATTITSMQLPHSRKQASFSKNSTVALPQWPEVIFFLATRQRLKSEILRYHEGYSGENVA